MKNTEKKIERLLRLLLIAFIAGLPMLLKAQNFDDNVIDNPVPVPFDGGVSILVAAGIAYGLKKANDCKKAGEFKN